MVNMVAVVLKCWWLPSGCKHLCTLDQTRRHGRALVGPPKWNMKHYTLV